MFLAKVIVFKGNVAGEKCRPNEKQFFTENVVLFLLSHTSCIISHLFGKLKTEYLYTNCKQKTVAWLFQHLDLVKVCISSKFR